MFRISLDQIASQVPSGVEIITLNCRSRVPAGYLHCEELPQDIAPDFCHWLARTRAGVQRVLLHEVIGKREDKALSLEAVRGV
jgi:hypothetical protein